MINADLLRRYTSIFGHTFTVSRWDKRPGDTLNAMMEAALAGRGPVVTDEHVARELATRLRPEPFSTRRE